MAAIYKKGSKGDEVKQIQTALRNSGYNIAVDGIYGSKTAAAVSDYQKKNKLGVDGIVGSQTWGSLFPTTSTTTAKKTTAPAKTTATAKPAATTVKKPAATTAKKTTTTTKTNAPVKTTAPAAYVPSAAVQQAQAALEAQLAKKPGAYTSSYQQQIDDVLNRILNREDFSFDLNGDVLWNQYKDQYTAGGKQAMMDTMGQAAALTGGYGNSYAQNAGQQAYQGYMQGMNNMIPELYQLALDRYNAENDAMLDEYALYSEQEAQDYARYADEVDRYLADLNRAEDNYYNTLDFDYGSYRDRIADARAAQEFEYAMSRDAAADAKWAAEFDEAIRQFNLNKGITGSSVGSGMSGSSESIGSRNEGDGTTATYNLLMDRVQAGTVSVSDIERYAENGLISKKQKENLLKKHGKQSATAAALEKFGYQTFK